MERQRAPQQQQSTAVAESPRQRPAAQASPTRRTVASQAQVQDISLPTMTLTPEDIKRRLMYFGSGVIPTTALLTYMTSGQFGPSLTLGAIAGSALAYFEPEIHNAMRQPLQVAGQFLTYLNRNNSGRARSRLLDREWWLTGVASTLYAEEEGAPLLETDEALLTDEQEEITREVARSYQEPQLEQKGGVYIPQTFMMDDVLPIVRQFNRQHSLYFGHSEQGAVAVPLHKMYHVLDVSSSGKGKSNRFRFAMMQLVGNCEVYYINPIAAAVKGVTDKRKIEVWQPIYDRLANHHPVKQGPEIKSLLTKLTDLIDERNLMEEEQDLSWMDHPVFLFVDEQPEVYARCPDAAALLDKIGRMGRNYLVFMWIASQSARVEDIGLSTATQAQMKTRIYGGADQTSGNRAMKGGISKEQERILQANGAGLTLILADGLADPALTRWPLVTNEAMFEYLRLGDFHMEDWIKQPKKTISAPSSPGISTPYPDLYPEGESGDTPGTSVTRRLDIENPKNTIALSQAQRMKLLQVLEADLEEMGQNKMIQEIWGYTPNSREGLKAADELRKIRAYIAQQQRIQLGL